MTSTNQNDRKQKVLNARDGWKPASNPAVTNRGTTQNHPESPRIT